MTVLTLTGGEAGGAVAERARRVAAGGRAAVGAGSCTRICSRHERQRGRQHDRDDQAGRSTRSTRRRVYTHTIHDVHQDHRNVHSATLVAARGVPQVYCYQAPSTTVDFHPTRFVAIDEYLERKIEVIQAYASQVKVRDYLDEELLRATARYWARFSQARYVEPLEVVRESDAPTPPGRDDTPATLPEAVALDAG